MADTYKDKVCIVTGGAGGLGRALCTELCRRGATVVIADIDGEGAGEIAANLTAGGGRAYPVRLDVTDYAEVSATVGRAVDGHGRMDCLFNNAGAIATGRAASFSIDDWKKVLDNNLYGAVNGSAAVFPIMARQGFGHIVNTASIAGLVPAPLAASYTASKHAIVGMSHALRIEGADLGVKVSVACPGKIQHRMSVSRTVNMDADGLNELLPRGTPLDICANAILNGAAKNKATIPVSASAWAMWLMYRISPSIFMSMSNMAARRLESKLRKKP